MSDADGKVALAVGDDIVGLPAGPDPTAEENLGRSFVRRLGEGQLRGRLERAEGPGCRWTLDFSEAFLERRILQPMACLRFQ